MKIYQKKILLFAKSIDGGTGTFFVDFLHFSKINKQLHLSGIVLEKPAFRKKGTKNLSYFANKGFYPNKYKIKLNFIVIFIKEMIWAYREIAKIKPSLIITIDSHCAIIVYFLNLIKKIDYIITIHNNLYETLKIKSTPSLFPIINFFLSKSFKKAKRIVCVSRLLAKNIKKKYKINNKISVIYYGVKNQVNFTREKNKRNIILSIMRMEEQKDHLTLIKAFQQLLKKIPTSILWLVGDGIEKNNLKQFVNKEGLSNNVRFYGWLNNLNSYFVNTDMFVLSSKREGFPYVLLEAMNFELPIVSTNCKFGPSEILSNGYYGLLVPVANKKKLSSAMISILENNGLYSKFVRRMRKRKKTFTLNEEFKQYKKLITSIN